MFVNDNFVQEYKNQILLPNSNDIAMNEITITMITEQKPERPLLIQNSAIVNADKIVPTTTFIPHLITIEMKFIHHHHHTETGYPSASSYYSPQTPYPPGAVHSWYSQSTCSGYSCRRSRPSARATSRRC